MSTKEKAMFLLGIAGILSFIVWADESGQPMPLPPELCIRQADSSTEGNCTDSVQAGNRVISTYVIRAISDNQAAFMTPAGLSNSASGTIDIVAARGEYEPASIVVRSTLEVDALQVHSSDLVSANGSQKIKSENVDISLVKEWYQAGGAWKSISKKGGRKLVPELLLKDDELVRVKQDTESNYLRIGTASSHRYENISTDGFKRGRVINYWNDEGVKDAKTLQPFDLRANISRQLWLNIFIPETAKPGKYTGEIRFISEGRVLSSVVLRLEVLSFQLDKPKIDYAIFYRGKLEDGIGSVSSEYKSEEQYRAELINIKEHGVVYPTSYQAPGKRTLFDKSIAIRNELGILGNSLFLVEMPAHFSESDKRYRMDLFKRVNSTLQNYDVKNVYLFGKDEAEHDTQRAQLKSWKSMRDVGAKVFATGYQGTFDNVGSELDVFILSGKPNEVEVRKFHKAGKKVYTYNFPQVGPENPLLFRRNYGIELWQAGVDGAMPYAYQESYQSTWNDFDHQIYRDHNFTYPVSDGVINTLAWEGFREAVDDVRYLTTLENLLLRSISSGECNNNSQSCMKIEDANKFLSGLKKTAPNDLDEVRANLIMHIKNITGVIE